MEQYIRKTAVVAEISKRREKNKKNKLNLAAAFEDNYFLSFIDSLEVKDVDLDKEIDLVEDKYHGFESLSRAEIIDVAKYFFELGLKVAQKGE